MIRNRTPVPSLLATRFPRTFLDRDEEFWLAFEKEEWDYEWDQDPFYGFVDIRRPPKRTVRRARGDCVDYAFVVASWLEAHGTEWQLGLTWDRWYGITYPTHAIVVSDGNIYSSGNVHEQFDDLDEYTEWRDEVRWTLHG